MKAPVLIGNGWTDDARIWISYRLNASNMRNGIFSLPSGLQGILVGQFSIQSLGTGSRTIIVAEGDRLSGLHRHIAIRGEQPDDILLLIFDPRQGSAELRFGEDTKGSGDAKEGMTPLGFATVQTSYDNRSTFIAGNDLTGDDKQWQPISTAPTDQDLEVRLEDSFGRYVLFFPCRLVAGEGRINSRLGTPLPADPVDWRDWEGWRLFDTIPFSNFTAASIAPNSGRD